MSSSYFLLRDAHFLSISLRFFGKLHYLDFGRLDDFCEKPGRFHQKTGHFFVKSGRKYEKHGQHFVKHGLKKPGLVKAGLHSGRTM